MTETAVTGTPSAPLNYLNADYGVRSWLLTKDHKRIGLLYLASITIFFALGGLAALMIRLELLTPAGDLLRDDNYNKMFTAHGVIMIFLFLIPTTLVFHNFWASPPEQLVAQRTNFLKNLAIMGGMLMVWAFGPGRYALETSAKRAS